MLATAAWLGFRLSSHAAVIPVRALTSQRLAEARTLHDAYSGDNVRELVATATANDIEASRAELLRGAGRRAHVAHNSGERGGVSRRSWAEHCTAHRTDGSACHAWAIRGGYLCRMHGGATPR